MNIKIIDNFLDLNYFKFLKSEVESASHPWYFQNKLSLSSDISNRDFGFNFWIFRDNGFTDTNISKFFSGLILKMLSEAECKNILRSRLDMTLKSGDTFHKYSPHVDYEIPHVTGIFYFTDSDGETLIFDKKYYEKKTELKVSKKIIPRENRLLLFDGEYLHTGHSPVNYERRILLNCNFSG